MASCVEAFRAMTYEAANSTSTAASFSINPFRRAGKCSGTLQPPSIAYILVYFFGSCFTYLGLFNGSSETN